MNPQSIILQEINGNFIFSYRGVQSLHNIYFL